MYWLASTSNIRDCSPGVEEERCVVPCPLDCRLSEWSTWSSCSAPCGGGVKVRARWLREKPFNGGRPCPKLNVKNQVRVALLQVNFSMAGFHSDLFYFTSIVHWCFIQSSLTALSWSALIRNLIGGIILSRWDSTTHTRTYKCMFLDNGRQPENLHVILILIIIYL